MQRRLAIVIHSLDGGGAERTAARMASHWAEAGHAVTLITLDSADRDRYPLSPSVERRGLDVMGHSPNPLSAIRNNLRRVGTLREAIRSAEAERVISFTDKTNVLTLAACRKLAVPVIVAERTDPRYHAIGPVWSWLRKRAYPRAESVVVQTASVRDALLAILPNCRVYVVPNLVEAAPAQSDQDADPAAAIGLPDSPDRKRVLGLGRLTSEKGFDLLLNAFGRTAQRRPHWDLLILGDGPERAALERRAAELQLSDRVFLPGWIDNPHALLRSADLFVLPSRYEGFPNALLEAMAAGLPAISFDCPSGPYEIIRDGHDGLLVRPESIEWLAAAMDRLMRDEPARRLLAQYAPEVLQRFSPEKYYARWEAVLDGRPEDDPVFDPP